MKSKNSVQTILALIIIVGFFALLALLAIRVVPKENMEMMLMIVGAVISGFSTIIGYFFGSSAGSAKKDETINNQSKPNEKN